MIRAVRKFHRDRRRGLFAAIATVAVFVTSFAAPAATAVAPAPLAVPGGPATVTTSVTYVSGADLTTPISELRATYGDADPSRNFGLSISYSCGAAAPCEDVTVTIAPQQLDSTYNIFRFARYVSATLPAGASIAPNEISGDVVHLGTLPAGASGTFTALYDWQERGPHAPAAQSFFLDGEEITTTVTADAANAGASHSASDVLTWRIDTMAPLVAFASQGLARADTDYSYTLRMASDCMSYRSTANHAEPSKLCAESYTNVFHMPTGATFVSASHGGAFDAGTGTVTWNDTGVSAATGWGSVNGFSAARNVTVQFPKAMFTDSCSATATASFDTSVTYLDGQVKSDSATTTHDITSCEPFALATKVAKSSTTQVSPNIIWDNGFANTFTIRVGNKANVAGVAVITDNGLGADHIRAHEVVADGGGKIAYTLDDNTTGTAVGTYTAPAGRRITAITVTSPEIAGPNKEQSSTPLVNDYNVRVKYTTVGIAPDTGWALRNTASAVMTYPGSNLPDFDSGSNAVDLVITPRPANFTSVMSTSLTTPGNPVPGVPVNFTLHGVTSAMKDGAAPEPQYIFIAPANWALVNNSWSLANGAPSGALFEKKTVTMDGEAREALAVTWPAGTTWGDNATWPALRLQAMPTAAATPGSQAIASGAIGDASHSFPGYTSTWGGASNGQRYTDVADIDGDSVTTEYFAVTTTKPITVGAAAALSSVKEICRVNADAADGCDWLSDSSQAVPISPVATDVKYRVTLRNNGTTSLSNVVAYDVLPHVGDTGISSGSAATPRGSQFAETVQTVPHVSSNLTLTYSESTNPCRSEVYPGGPADCAANWSTEPAGAVSVRAAVTGTLAPGAEATFTYTANVLGAPVAGERACNSIATAATGVPVSEPSPVCAIVEAADLAVTVEAPDNLQLDRPSTVPFTVTNVSGNTAVPVVSIDVPANMQVSSLEFDNWVCSANDTAPIHGPASLECTYGEALAASDSVALSLPIVVTASPVTVSGTVSSPLHDDDNKNNEATITLNAAAAPLSGLTVVKDDAVPAAVPGQLLTYTINVSNQLIGEPIADVSIVDALPANVEFVSASDGGSFDGTEVTWNVAELASAASAQVSVTVRVLDAAGATTLQNSVVASASDPAFAGVTLSGQASDTNHIDRIALTKTASLRAPASAQDPRAGDVVEYTIVASNIGGGTITGVDITDAMAGLSALDFPAGWPTAEGTLAAGESVTAMATYVLTEDDIDAGSVANAATVVAQSGGGEEVEASATATMPLPAVSALSFTKSASLDATDGVHAGDTITYTFEISNDSNVTVHTVSIADDLAGLSAIDYDWPRGVSVLAAGESVTAVATYVLTQADLDRGLVSNTATASAIAVDGTELSESDSADVTLVASPGATFKKEGSVAGSGDSKAGDIVTYSFTIENTGNVTLTGIAIAEHLVGVGSVVFAEWPGAEGELAPGESTTASAEYVLTQADVDAGEVVNVATLSAVPTRGTLDDIEAQHSLSLASGAALTLVKSAVLYDDSGDGLANTDERIRYTFTLTNVGNVTLTNVTVADAKVSGLSSVATLAPGESIDISADDYTVTAEEATQGAVENTATVTATAPSGETVISEPSSVSTPAGPHPEPTPDPEPTPTPDPEPTPTPDPEPTPTPNPEPTTDPEPTPAPTTDPEPTTAPEPTNPGSTPQVSPSADSDDELPATGASVDGWTLTTGLVVAGLGLALVLIGTRRRKHSMIAKRH